MDDVRDGGRFDRRFAKNPGVTFMKPTDESEGVEDIFASRSSPVASSIMTASVNVPPMSTPNLYLPITPLFS